MIRRAALVLLIACSHPPPPHKPTPAVSATIASAETAELARQHDVARARFEQAIADAHDPASLAYAHHAFAETLVQWGLHAEAKTHLEAAVAAKPDDAGSWHDLGLVLNHDGDLGGARAALERAKQLSPNDPRPRITLAVFLWCHDDLAAATTEYRGLLELDLPDRLREKVRWALDQLAKPGAHGCRTDR